MLLRLIATWVKSSTNPGSHSQAEASGLPLGDEEKAGHEMHRFPNCVVLPFTSLYVPGAHAVHTPPSGPMYPLLHTHACEYMLCTGESEKLLHARHWDDPLTPLYVPAAHAKHGPPSGPVKAALHTQSVALPLALLEMELLGHSRHAVAPEPLV